MALHCLLASQVLDWEKVDSRSLVTKGAESSLKTGCYV